MTPARLLIFDDGGGAWGPLTDRRPVFALRSGAATTRERIERVLGQAADALVVPERLAAVVAQRWPGVAVNLVLSGGEPWRLVNGRWNALAHADLVRTLEPGELLLDDDGAMIAGCLSADQARLALSEGAAALPEGVARQAVADHALLRRPWHLLDDLDAAVRADLAASDLPIAHPSHLPGVVVVGEHPVRVAEDARLLPTVVINATAGPVAIDHGALIHPFVALEGPCYVGRQSVLAAHTALRPGTVIGSQCKVGGEVSASVIHSHSNKAHLGYLGNSYVGQWCNLGADTNVSNLKNTYGEVRVQLEAARPAEPTGRTTHGPLLGDFVRTAIGTRLLTGSVVGTGAMLAGSGYPPKLVARFAFLTDAGQQAHDLERFLETARQMLGRREMSLAGEEEALLRALHGSAAGPPEPPSR